VREFVPPLGNHLYLAISEKCRFPVRPEVSEASTMIFSLPQRDKNRWWWGTAFPKMSFDGASQLMDRVLLTNWQGPYMEGEREKMHGV
jgi:hypothetical protein